MDIVCRTCFDVIASGSPCFSLNMSEPNSSAVIIKEKLKACVPELAVDLVENSVLCNDCMDALCAAYKFKKKCLETEASIYDYIQKTDAEGESIDIGKVVRWTSKFYSCKHLNDLKNTSSVINVGDTNVSDNSDSHETIHDDDTNSSTIASCNLEIAVNNNVSDDSDSHKTIHEEVTNINNTISCSLKTALNTNVNDCSDSDETIRENVTIETALNSNVSDYSDNSETINEEVTNRDATVSYSLVTAFNTHISDSNNSSKISHKTVKNRISCSLQTIDKIIENIHISADLNKHIFSTIIQDAADDQNKNSVEKSQNTENIESSSVSINNITENSSRNFQNAANTEIVSESCIVKPISKVRGSEGSNGYKHLHHLITPVLNEGYLEHNTKQKHLPRIFRKTTKTKSMRNGHRNKLRKRKGSLTKLQELYHTYTKIRTKRNGNALKFDDISMSSLKLPHAAMDREQIGEEISNLGDMDISNISMCSLKLPDTAMNREDITEEIPNPGDMGIKNISMCSLNLQDTEIYRENIGEEIPNLGDTGIKDISVCSLKLPDAAMDRENIAEEIQNLGDVGIIPVIINWSGIENENSISLDDLDLSYTNTNNFDFENFPIKMEKSELDEPANLLFCDENDIKPIVSKEKSGSECDNIISGMSCSFEDFCMFEQQYLGYTMDEFYSNQLVALPECSVIVTPLSNAELEKWTRKDCLPNSQETKKKKSQTLKHRNGKMYLFHVRKHHKYRRINRCTMCNYNAEYKCSLLYHMQQLHGKEYVQTDNKLVHSCHFCQFSSTCENVVKDHAKIHVEAVVYKCHKCKFHTVDEKAYQNHIRCHALYKFKCVKCIYSTAVKRSLKRHYFSCHFRFKPFVCSVCEQQFCDRTVLIQHVLSHPHPPHLELNTCHIEHNYAAKQHTY